MTGDPELNSLLPTRKGDEFWFYASLEFLYLAKPAIPRVPCQVYRRNRDTGDEQMLCHCRCLTDARQWLEGHLKIKL